MIKLTNTPEQIELVNAIGSKDAGVSIPASEAFAAAIGPVLQEILMQAGTSSLIFNDFPFQEDANQTIPLALFRGEADTYVNVWSSTAIPGGLATNEISSVAELKFSTHKFETAVSFPKKYARLHNLNVLAAATERMLNEVLIKRELVAWSVLMRAIGEASTVVNNVNTSHIISAGTAGVFKVADLSKFITKARRINVSYAGGTAQNPFSKGITDLFISPEVKEQIRSFAYNPMNTTAVPNTDESTVLGLPDSVREEIYRNAGTSSIFNINFTDLNEFGVTQKYNTLFSLYAPAGCAPGGANFNGNTNEILFGVDLTKKDSAFFRPVATDAYTSNTFQVLNDDQFPMRADKVGYYGSENGGYVVADARALLALVI